MDQNKLLYFIPISYLFYFFKTLPNKLVLSFRTDPLVPSTGTVHEVDIYLKTRLN